MKKILLALALVAFMTSSAFASVNLDVIGLLGGRAASAGTPLITAGPLAATAVSFDVTPDVSLAIGAISITADEDTGAKESVLGLYANGYYKLLQTGAISQHIGLELAMVTESESEDAGTVMNLNYRVKAQVLGEVSLLADVELVSINSGTVTGGDAAGAITTILEGAKVGLSIPILEI